MARTRVPVSSACAVLVFTGIMLLLSIHHAGSIELWSSKWAHFAAYTIAVAMIACPIISWVRKN
ncbi:MAG: hypothetical protein AAF404_01890 [Pseudomonadota bacterium]